MFQTIQLVSFFGFLVLAGNLAATSQVTPLVSRDLRETEAVSFAEKRLAVAAPLPDLPDAPSVTASGKTSVAAERPWQHDFADLRPESGTKMAVDTSPEFQTELSGKSGWANHAAPTLFETSQPPRETSSGFHLFLKLTYTPTVLASTFFDATLAQHENKWPGYGRGVEGFGKRYCALLADRSASHFFDGYLMPTRLHQDPHYRRLGSGPPIWRRTEYSISRVVLTKSEAGSETFNSSLLMGILLTKSVQNLYYPREQRGFDPTVRRTEESLINQFQSNLENEFLPDIESFVWRRLPSRLKRLERRIPFSQRWQPEALAD